MKKISIYYLPYPRECNPGVLLIFWVFRPRTVVYFGEKSAKITVFLADFSPKMTKVRPKYVAWGCIQDGVVFTRIRYYLDTKIISSAIFSWLRKCKYIRKLDLKFDTDSSWYTNKSENILWFWINNHQRLEKLWRIFEHGFMIENNVKRKWVWTQKQLLVQNLEYYNSIINSKWMKQL